jgi:hypothetical protein
MELFAILAILVIATVIVLGWIRGSLFFCVFLTLPAVAAIFIDLSQNAKPTMSGAANTALFALLVIWLPRMWRWANPRH